MIDSPRVSILLPVRDAAATLDTALRSVARQSEHHFECIIVDDGSRDASVAIARKWSQRDRRFRSVGLERARGLVHALDVGRLECRARYVARMDADDAMNRNRLALQLEAIERDGLDAIGCHVRVCPRSGLSDGMRAYEAWLRTLRTAEDVFRDRFIECPLAHPTLLLRRQVLDAHPYRDCGWPEDYDLILRLLGAGLRVGMLPRRLLAWRDGPGRLSRSDERYSQASFTECKAEHLAAGFLRDHEHYVLWGHGPTGRRLRRALAARDRTASHIVEVHPRRIGRSIGGAPVIAPTEIPRLPAPRHPLVTAVSGAGPRAEIRGALEGFGLRENLDFVCAA